ncbi:MAG: hypothetical protein AAF437_03810 [Pseudomonadota bacterium]
MNVIYRSAGTIVVAGLIIGWATMRSEQKQENMIAHFGLDVSQTEFATNCVSSLNLYDKEFKEGASHHAGCGCMASELGKTAEDGVAVNYSQMATAFGSVVKFSETDSGKETDIAAMFEDMTVTRGLSYPDAIMAATEIGRSMDLCKNAELPKAGSTMNAVSVGQQPYQPTVIDAPTNSDGCAGLSAESIATLQKIADRDGKTLEQICARVVS